MSISNESQKVLRENNLISDQEIALEQGDLYFAENVITRKRRILDASIVKSYVRSGNIVESKSKSQLLKG